MFPISMLQRMIHNLEYWILFAIISLSKYHLYLQKLGFVLDNLQRLANKVHNICLIFLKGKLNNILLHWFINNFFPLFNYETKYLLYSLHICTKYTAALSLYPLFTACWNWYKANDFSSYCNKNSIKPTKCYFKNHILW